MAWHELGLVALTGLLGAPHCIGMCGGIMSSMTLQAKGSVVNIIMAYNLGRIFTYTLLGIIMGGAGSFVEGAGRIAGFQAMASLIGGVFILLWTYRRFALPLTALAPTRLKLVQGYLSRLKQRNGRWPVFLSGILLGFLPCGLTYAMEINAVASASIWQGGIIMFVFGMSTLPALALTGWMAGLVKKSLRKRLFFYGNIVATVIGCLAILRGMAANGWIPSVHPWLW